MTRICSVLLLVSGLTGAGISFAGPVDEVTQEARKLDCFRRHAVLLDRPSHHTVWKCWEIHGHLMGHVK